METGGELSVLLRLRVGELGEVQIEMREGTMRGVLLQGLPGRCGLDLIALCQQTPLVRDRG